MDVVSDKYVAYVNQARTCCYSAKDVNLCSLLTRLYVFPHSQSLRHLLLASPSVVW